MGVAQPSTYPVCTMLIDLIQFIPMDLPHFDLIQTLHFQALHLPALDLPTAHDHPVLAQVIAQFKETNIQDDVSKVWGKFVRTGQVWAFLIGMIIGYLAKSFTSYG